MASIVSKYLKKVQWSTAKYFVASQFFRNSDFLLSFSHLVLVMSLAHKWTSYGQGLLGKSFFFYSWFPGLLLTFKCGKSRVKKTTSHTISLSFLFYFSLQFELTLDVYLTSSSSSWFKCSNSGHFPFIETL